MSIYAPILYDAFYAYLLALAKTMKENGMDSKIYRNGTLIAKNAQNLVFDGM